MINYDTNVDRRWHRGAPHTLSFVLFTTTQKIQYKKMLKLKFKQLVILSAIILCAPQSPSRLTPPRTQPIILPTLP